MEHPDRGVGRVWDLDTRGQEVGGVHEIIEFSWTSFIYDPSIAKHGFKIVLGASFKNVMQILDQMDGTSGSDAI